MIITDARTDERFCNHPGLDLYGIRSYIAVPLFRRDGTKFGTLCALDPRPSTDLAGHIPLFQLVAELIGHEMEAAERAEERERLMAAVQRANRRLELRNEELDRFSYVISHDLKAPLRGIENLVTFLEEDAAEHLGEESLEHLGLVRDRATRLQSLIDALLRYSRVGRGDEAEEDVEEVELDAVIGDASKVLSMPAHVRLRKGDDLGSVRATRVHLHHVFQNLLSNAFRYAASEVRIERRDLDDRVVISLSDDGAGLPAADRDRVWEAFVTRSADRAEKRIGVGLPIVRKLVAEMEGTVRVEDADGGGAMFIIELPRTD